MTGLYDRIGIRRLCEEKISHYFGEAAKCLDRVQVPEERKRQLRLFMRELVHREV